MTDALEIQSATLWDVECVYGGARDWMWVRGGGGLSAIYNVKGYPNLPGDFLTVLWEVRTPKETPVGKFRRIVFLEVDSPRHEHNATLNTLKRDLVTILIHSAVPRIMSAKGYGCSESGLRRTEALMRECRTTAVFRVLPGDHTWRSPKDAIHSVHADLGKAVDDVLQPFKKRLEEVFGY